MNVAVVHADIFRLVEQQLAVTLFLGRRRLIRQLGNMLSPGLGRDRRQQVQVLLAITELDAPGDNTLFFVTDYSDGVAQRGEVCVTTYVDSVVRSGLNT